jgi:hypothetical protein
LIGEILAFNDQELERRHDFIQMADQCGKIAVFSEELTSSKDKRRESPKPKRRENSKVAFQLLNGRQKR